MPNGKSLEFVVYDAKAATYDRKMLQPTEGMAVRAFADAVHDEGTILYHHPEDFSLWLTAEFDHETGETKPLPLRCVVKGNDVWIATTADLTKITGADVRELRANIKESN